MLSQKALVGIVGFRVAIRATTKRTKGWLFEGLGLVVWFPGFGV